MSNLERFEHAKQAILGNLFHAKKFVEQQSLHAISNEFKIMHQTLQREQFEVMVVGEFSNGKSTFINALMQNIVLPSSNVPTTAFINKITYADIPKFEVHFDNGKREELNREEFLAYVSEDKQKFDQVKDAIIQKLNPLAKQATHLQIGYPTDICKNNIVIIDSPGTNDMDERRVQITDEYIPKSDAAIFVLNAKRIFSASERAFLQRIMDADIQKIFFVINFKDVIQTEAELHEIEQVVMENLPQGLLQPKVHFVSALHALQHYVPPAESNNPRARRRQAARLPLEMTGMPELELALYKFLTEDSGQAKLLKPLQRAEKLLREVINQHLDFEIQSLSQSIQNIEQHVEEIHRKLQVAEKNIKSDAQEFYRQVERDMRDIVIWYKEQIAEIASVAKNCLNKGVLLDKDPEAIKTDIDLETGSLEKNLKQQLKEKTERMTSKLFSNHVNQLNDEISILSFSLLNQNDNKPAWDRVIPSPSNSSDERVADMAVGGAIVGGALLLITGGLFGWGLLGAGAGAAAVGAYKVNNKSNTTEELKRQVRNRYENGLTNQAKEVEKDFEKLANQLRNYYEDYMSNIITIERQRADNLLANQKMSANEKYEKIEALKKQQKIGESLIYQLNKTYSNYCQKEEVSVYV